MLFGIDRKSIWISLLILICAFSQITCAQKENSFAARKAEAETHIAKAVELQKSGDFQTALSEQLKVVELLPDDAGQLVVLASIYARLKDYKNAVETGQKAVDRLPDDVYSREVFAIILEEAKDKQGALKQRLETVRLAPNDTRLLTNLGAAYGALDKNNLERETYQRAIAIDPNYIDAIYNLALLEAEEKNNEKAIELFKNFIEKAAPNKDPEGVERAKAKIKELEQSKK